MKKLCYKLSTKINIIEMCFFPLKSDSSIKILMGNINIFNLLNLRLGTHTVFHFLLKYDFLFILLEV